MAMITIRGESIRTFTGRTFFPMDPDWAEIDIADIAHSLSHLCRFAGHCREFYSVGDHSCRVAEIVAPENRKWALLHDAAEAYLVDLPRPIKRFPGLGDLYKMAEARVEAAVAQQFRLTLPMPAEIKVADNILLITELRDLMGRKPRPYERALEGTIEPLSPAAAKAKFLSMFRELFADREAL
jgi:uncharacterized protein